MAEPAQTAFAGASVMAFAVSVVGPNAGPYVVILVCSVGGGLWALSGTKTGEGPVTRAQIASMRKEGAWLLFKCAFTAMVLTSVIANAVEARFEIKVGESYGFVSLIIGMLGNKWQDIIDAVKNRVVAVISTLWGSK